MIRANVCPYCDGRYGVAFGGCENDCRESRYVVAMIRAALDEEETWGPGDGCEDQGR